MNMWAVLLAESPTLVQRLIARTQRISLPRGCDAATRVARLRLALCRQATVRAMYALLDADVRAALQSLRLQPGSIAPDDLAARYGPIRPLRAIAADPKPQTISERLLLLGWLLPRPATPFHPARYLLPPELRRWLPRPLDLSSAGAPSQPSPPPSARCAATTLLLTLAARTGRATGLALRADGSLRTHVVRLLAARLDLPLARATPLLQFVLPLLCQLGLVAVVRGRATLMPEGQRFLRRTPDEQLGLLRDAWLAQSAPDGWLCAQLIDERGIDWPLLRRRLVAWAEQLPPNMLLNPAGLYDRLAATLGPLADSQTHGFRTIDRAPWQPRRAAAIWNAALSGPLCWLGWVAFEPLQGCAAQPLDSGVPEALDAPEYVYAVAAAVSCAAAPPLRWSYPAPGMIAVPLRQLDGDVLRLLSFADWQSTQEQQAFFVVTPATLARATRQGWSNDALRALLDERAGPVPDNWWAQLEPPQALARIQHAAILTVEPPELLARAARSRSVRRYIEARPAPGVALVTPERVATLARVLERLSLAVNVDAAPTTAPPDDLMPGERAALLLACAVYRQHAPPDAPLLLDDLVERRLAAGLPPRLRATVAHALEQLTATLVPRLADTDTPGAETAPPPDDSASFLWFPPAGLPDAAVAVPGEPTVSGLPVLAIAPLAAGVPDAPAADSAAAALLNRAQPDTPAVLPVPGDEDDLDLRAPLPALPLGEAVRLLREALRRRRFVALDYEDRAGQRSFGRLVRPLDLERHGDIWYLRAYCVASRAERTFRLDRIGGLTPQAPPRASARRRMPEVASLALAGA